MISGGLRQGAACCRARHNCDRLQLAFQTALAVFFVWVRHHLENLPGSAWDTDTTKTKPETSVSGQPLQACVKGSLPRKKESGDAIVPRTLGKVCTRTLLTTVRCYINRKKKRNKANSSDFSIRMSWGSSEYNISTLKP